MGQDARGAALLLRRLAWHAGLDRAIEVEDRQVGARPTELMAWLVIGGAVGGHLLGRQIRVPRCSACATTLKDHAPRCPASGAVMRGDIAHLSDRRSSSARACPRRSW